MAEFLKGNALNAKLDEILENAEQNLILISPYIKFHAKIKEILLRKKNQDNLLITIVFGKNEEKKEQSFSKEDFEFLGSFPNVKIKYEPRLHAKYYANDAMSILSSMNLYEYSQNNNIEFGIYTETQGFFDNLMKANTLDKDAWDYFKSVLENSELLYHRTPVYEDKLLGLKKKYVRSDVEVDKMDAIYGAAVKKTKEKSTTSTVKAKLNDGYCIRTGEKIPFDIKMPYSKKAYASWNRYKKQEYPEKYCHYSGEESKGETSMKRPILKKNWKKAKS